jgi:hypothetical protein
MVPIPDTNPRSDPTTPLGRPDEIQVHGDVPFLDAESLPPPPTDRRFSRLVRRIDYPALEQQVGVLDAELARLHDPVVRRFQEFLDRLAGEACPVAEDNHKLVALVNKRVDGLGLQLMYARQGSELVDARLRYTPGMLAGTFEVWTPGRRASQLYSGVAFPRLVAARALSADEPE